MKYLKLDLLSERLVSNEELLDYLFPFHFIVNEQLNIEKNGPSLKKFIGSNTGGSFHNCFVFERPNTPVNDFKILKENTGKLVILNTKNKTLIRGELILIEEGTKVLFLGSPWFANTAQFLESGLEIADFSIQDPMIDMLYLMQSKEIDYADLQELLGRTNQQKEELAVANANLKKHAKILANSNAELERFAYAASHDLQEPLRMVTSFLSLLETKYQDIVDESGKRYIEFAINGAGRMRDMIVDLLEYSRVGRMASNLENIDLNTLLEEIISSNKLLIEEKNVAIEYYNLPTIKNYKSPMTQVFNTLVVFGIENSKGNKGSLIRITCESKNNNWAFCIKDNGKGVESKILSDMFLIFKNKATFTNSKTNAYSLPVIKKIIENQGGEIWAKSEPGAGCEFNFTVPINR